MAARAFLLFALAMSVAANTVTAAHREQNPGNTQRPDTVVRNISAPRYRGVATLSSEVQIGGASATADEYVFSAIAEVLPLRDGSMAVIDRGSGSSVFVRVYDSAGKYLRTLGRYGEGPGEHRAPSGMAELPDGRIVVRDGQGGRLTAFAGSGSGTPLFTANSPGLVISPDYLSVTPGGTLYLVTAIRGGGNPRPPARDVFIRLRADGSVIDTIEYPRLAAADVPQLTVMRNSGGYTSQFAIGLPYFPVTQSLLSPLGYLVTVNTERYAIDLRMPATPPLASADPPPVWKAGDRVVSLRRSVQPVPVPEAERAEVRSRIEERMREYQAGWQWNGPQVPRVKPPLKGIAMGLDGRIWAQLSTVSERFAPEAGTGRRPATWRETGSLFDVLEPDGTYIGQVAVSEGTRILARRGEHVWGVTRDTNDVPTLHRFRIVWR